VPVALFKPLSCRFRSDLTLVPMRYLFAILFVLVLLAGLLFGALNPQPVPIDLYFVSFELRLGVALLFALLGGAVVGGACAALAIGLRRRRQRRIAAAEPVPLPRVGSELE
jgi:lipopolysaccharide assembly protein A